MTIRILCFIFCSLIYASYSEITDLPLITKNGPIIGVRRGPNPATNISYDAFLGIPYGQVPKRFQLAESRNNWTQPLYTQSDGPACPQPYGHYAYSEDCLYLNVFTPVNASQTPGSKAVIAIVHGSAFTRESCNSTTYTPDYMVAHDVVIVAMNFRLGAPGFLTLGSTVSPGNLALHDVLLALQWVQNEIYTFGGDPSRVTLYGTASGSVMTQMHYLSQLSAGSGYFQRAIASSGSALAKWAQATPGEGAHRARILADFVGCDTKLNDSALLTCLQEVDIDYIVGNETKIPLTTYELASGRNFPFVPVLDTHLTSSKPFFNSSWENLMALALGRSIPLLTGVNSDEGIIKFEDGGALLVEANLEAFFPDILTSLNDKEKTALVKRIKNHYFNSSAPDENKVKEIITVLTDTMFAYPSIQMTRYFAEFTYSYLFTFKGTWYPVPSYFAKYRMVGVSHAEELAYLFYNFYSNSIQDNSSCTENLPNIITKDRITYWWTNFAKTGVPDPSWRTVAEGGYLVINSTLYTMSSSDYESRFSHDFWNNVYQTQSCASSTTITFATMLMIVLWSFIYKYL